MKKLLWESISDIKHLVSTKRQRIAVSIKQLRDEDKILEEELVKIDKIILQMED